MTPEENFSQLGLELPPAPTAQFVYKTYLVDGKHCYVSGHGPYLPDGTFLAGRVGKDMTEDEAKAAAQQTGLAILATLREGLGSLNKVKRVIKILGMVNCESDFTKQPYVINGCSELFAKVWGQDNGIGVRSAVGMGSLPGNIPVEIEASFELE